MTLQREEVVGSKLRFRKVIEGGLIPEGFSKYVWTPGHRIEHQKYNAMYIRHNDITILVSCDEHWNISNISVNNHPNKEYYIYSKQAARRNMFIEVDQTKNFCIESAKQTNVEAVREHLKDLNDVIQTQTHQ